MPYANNEGIRIHYQVAGEGPPLVFQHGFGGYLKTWYDMGYVDALKDKYQLILMDTRGHGASDKPHDPKAYGMETLAADVVSVLDDLGVGKAPFYGYSMGGRIGFGMAKYAPQRVCSLIIGGMHPYDRKSDAPDGILELLRQGLDAYVAAVTEMLGPRMNAETRDRLLNTDIEALIALRVGGGLFDGFEDTLPSIDIPCLLFAGGEDGLGADARRASEVIPNATFVSLPGLNHGEVLMRNDLVLPHITGFLAELGQD